MARFKKVNNERSEAIELIKLMDSIVKNKTWKIKSIGGESTLNTGSKRMFPDVFLYGDTSRIQVLQGWEIKMPDVLITDFDFIYDAQRKADVLGVNSCVIWNFASCVLYIKNDKGWEKAYQFNLNNLPVPMNIARDSVPFLKPQWEAMLIKLLYLLNEFFDSGILHPARIGDIITDTIFTEIIERNKITTAEYLQSAGIKNTVITAYISQWWRDIEKEYKFDEVDKFTAYAKFILLNWLNKLTFANMIKSNHNPAMAVESINEDISPTAALDIFKNITEKCDFYNVFETIQYSDILPTSTWIDLTDYNAFLYENGLSQVPQSALQSVLENSVNQFKRSVNGVFTTPPKLAEILVKAGVTDLTRSAIDPCCGTGTIATEILIAKESAIGIENAFATTYASDKFSFPLQISNISMTRANAINLPSLLFQSNAFDIYENKEIEITDPQSGKIKIYKLPKFESVISNLPFVAFDQEGREESNHMTAITERVRTDIGISLSGRADLYQGILLHLYDSLSDNASVAVITSNSWLGTAAGDEFFETLNCYYHVESIVASGNGKWFDNANVIALMLFLKKKPSPQRPETNHKISFGLIQEKLSNLSDDFTAKIVDSIILKKAIEPSLFSLRQYTMQQIYDILNMSLSRNSLFYDVSWILDLKEKLVPISEVFKAARGERRGWNDMFHLPLGHKVEARYVKRMLKSSRSISSLTAVTDTDAFCCSESIEEMEKHGQKGALEWIKKFKGGTNTTGVPLVEALQKSGLHWYEMRDDEVAEIVTSQKPNQRLFFAKSEKPIFINQNIIGFNSKESYSDIELNHALLNSIIGIFYIEASGFGRGQGVLDISATNIIKSFMLNPKLVDSQQRLVIMEKFNKLLNREVYNTDVEMANEDRLEFEKTVAECFGYLDYFERIKNAVLEMQKVRLSVR